MKQIKPENTNYCGIVVQIKNVVELPNCDNLQGVNIFGNNVITDKSIKVGDVGVYFPVEVQLSESFLYNNNLNTDPEKNKDKTKKGYISSNGRIRCIKLRGINSEGLFLPIKCLEYVIGNQINNIEIGYEFDKLYDLNNNIVDICKKYVVTQTQKTNSGTGVKHKKINKSMVDLLIDNQFRFHEDTSVLYKNLHKIDPYDVISLTYKCHGSSGIASKVLLKKKLNLISRLVKRFNVDINDVEYGYVYSSGKPKSKLPKGIVGKYINPNEGFYSDDIWKISFEFLKDYLYNGLTLYYEIVGFTPTGTYIQKGYDYGCTQPKNREDYIEGVNYKIYIYRITHTSTDGKVIEFSAKQVQDWCKNKGLRPVVEMYYGYAIDMFEYDEKSNETWSEALLKHIKQNFNEKDCFICNNKVPEEGVVLRVEKNDLEVFKCKSTRFLEYETKQLDNNEVNIEDVE